MTAHVFAMAMAGSQVNGPKDVPLEWDAVCWRTHEANVRRLRRRIFKAVQEQDLAQVRNLQKLMVNSWSNTLVSVRQATQRNAGRKTPGIDGKSRWTPRPGWRWRCKYTPNAILGRRYRSRGYTYRRLAIGQSSGRSEFL